MTPTPGPWIFESTDIAKRDVEAQLPDDCLFWIVGQDGAGEVLALVIETSQKEAEANARLFATARDLLDVARIEHELHMSGFTLATARRLGPDAEHAYRSGGTPGLNNWRREKREAAIAKAEGRS